MVLLHSFPTLQDSLDLPCSDNPHNMKADINFFEAKLIFILHLVTHSVTQLVTHSVTQLVTHSVTQLVTH